MSCSPQFGDDLTDGGAQHYVDCIKAIREACPETRIEALTPDFQAVAPQ